MGRSLGICLTVSCILGFISDRFMVLRNYVQWKTVSGTLAVLPKEIADFFLPPFFCFCFPRQFRLHLGLKQVGLVDV